MNTFTANPLELPWPVDALETISACPYCGSPDHTLAHEGVQDWSFGCAPGKWNYWGCSQCRALYLNPRPTSRSMGKAYGRYYTHDAAAEKGLLSVIKQRVRNEYWSHTLQTTIGPRLGTPSWAAVFFKRLKPWIAEPFGLRQLAQMPKGYLIDVGCGNGNTLKTAQQLGWRTLGIELDAHAVKAARAQGLLVIQGGYDELRSLAGQADCLMCSHVLEHVQEPLEMLRLLLAALKPRGVLLLSTPNASSYLRDFYGENWRGLEAPRHLAIADAAWLMNWLCAQGFQCTQVPCWDGVSAIESERIRRRDLTTRPTDVKAGKRAVRLYGKPSLHKHDTVQIVCTRA